ncbi:MAG: glycosyltransferase family 2 protein [Spirochaetaceae bacterium]|nr:glycosyltransferase family 2 protein [Spirochaetaceae bacterium]
MISIAMTTYNGQKYLAEQIDSILAQSYLDFEFIISDDCSTDLTRQILLEYEKKDKRIKLHFNEKNLGFKKNFEQAVRLCSGDFIALADQDDVWTENHLEILMNNIGKADLVGADAVITDSNLNPLGYTMQDVTGIKINQSDSAFLFLHELYSNIFQGTACLFRAAILDSLLPIPECALFHDHWAALTAGIGNGLSYSTEPVLLYRQHEEQVTENPKQTLFGSIKQTIKKREKNRIEREHLVQMLELLVLKTSDSEKQLQISKVIEYNKNILKGKRISALCHFVRNYKVIYGETSFVFFVFRFIKILLGLI